MEINAAREIVQSLIDLLAPDCERIEIGGSIRRGKPEVHDGEIVAIGKPGLLRQVDSLLNSSVVEKAQYGEKKTTRWGPSYRGMIYRDMLVELFLADTDNWGYVYWLRTGPADANKWLMQWLSFTKAPVRPKDGCWWHGEQKLRVASEEDLFTLLGMPFIPAAERSEAIYKKLLQNNRAHHWPDFEPFYARPMEDQALWADEVTTVRQMDSGPCKLLNGESFAAVRDQMALEHYRARLPVLKAEIARIYAEIAPIWEELRVHVLQHGYLGGTYNKRHAYEKIYAQMNGCDLAYQRLTAELAAIERDMWRRWHVPIPSPSVVKIPA